MATEQSIPPLSDVNRWVQHYRREIGTFQATLDQMGGNARALAGAKPNTTRQPRGTSEKRAAAGRKGGRARARKMGQGGEGGGSTS
jgi:hypothetical protein